MRFTLGYQVLIAVILAIITGLFLGPLSVVFKPIGTIYFMLFQMVVLPYICLSIIHGLGSFTPSLAKQLLKKGWPFYLILWGTVFFVIYLFTVLIPTPTSVSFNPEASSLTLEEKLTTNLLDYLIPKNPISAFVNNVVPAIAVFGVIVGIAIMHLEKKEPLLSLIERGDRIIEKILDWLAAISPIGVFTHIVVVVGTVQFSELLKINWYLFGFILMTCLITFWILPLILSSCTPLSFQESSKAIRSVGLLPFVTGISTVAIPFINKYLREIGKKHQLPSMQHKTSVSQTVVPISYSFVQIGNALLLFFILFAAFYYRHPIAAGEKPFLSFLTIPLSIGSTTSINSVSFLFTELQFPSNAIELYAATVPITMNFQVLLSVAGILTFILLVLFAQDQRLQLKLKKLAFHLLGSLVVLSILVFTIRPFIHLKDNFYNLYLKRKIGEAIQNPVSAKVYLEKDPLPSPRPHEPEKLLAGILRSGVLRVGYGFYDMPYVYMNQDGELVGFDVAMAYELARDLNCRLEFVPLDLDHIGEELDQGRYDIAMSAIVMTEERIKTMSFTNAYSDQNTVLLVPREKKGLFANLEIAKKNQSHLTIGATGGYKAIKERIFPGAKLDVYPEINYRGGGGADAWMWSQIPATIYSLVYPDFVVMDYQGQLGKSYLAYPVRPDALKLLEFMNNWIKLKISSGFYQEQVDYWIAGKSPQKGEPRWSIIRNVLHWVD